MGLGVAGPQPYPELHMSGLPAAPELTWGSQRSWGQGEVGRRRVAELLGLLLPKEAVTPLTSGS